MPSEFQARTLYDSMGNVGGGVNEGDSPLDLPPDTLAGGINLTVRGKKAGHRPAFFNRPITYVNVSGQISPTQTAVQQGQFQGMTEAVCLDDTANAYLVALISGRVFSFAISGNTITCTELLIHSGGQSGNTVDIRGGKGTGATVTGATITGATISAGTITSGTIIGATVTGATLNGGDITAGTVTAGTIVNTAGSSYAITGSPTISAGYVELGTITNFTPSSNSSTTPITGPAPVQPQAWLWQSELWVVIQDGAANAIVVNLNTQVAVRSNYGAKVPFTTTTSSGAVVAPVGSTFTVGFSSVSNLSVGSQVFIYGTGYFAVTNISGTTVTLQTQYGNGYLNSGETAQWSTVSTLLPPGRMGAYGEGRNWMSLISPRQFIALDIVQGASGTSAFQYRDAVLNSTENSFITGGGTFQVPGNYPITAMKFQAVPDQSLGQGPLLVFTHKSVFSCQAPVDRLTWQSLTNPILTESVISNGAKGQWSTIVSNSDMIYRSVDGIRSYLLAQLEQNTWGTSPQSFEVSPILDLDSQALLNFTSAIVFNNRMLMTVGPVQNTQGVYFQAMTAMNFAPISSLRGKAPAVWDSGTWIGSGPTSQMQVLQLTVGEVSQSERAFALVLNTTAAPPQIELWEILGDGGATYDDDGTNQIPIQWQFDSRSLRFGIPKEDHVYMFLSNGEIWVDNLIGTVTFQALYKADQFPAWTPWHAWQTCQNSDSANSQPGFLPRMGLGEPSGKPVDYSSNRPLRSGFTFQVRLIIVGHCVFEGAFFETQAATMPKFAKQVTQPVC